MDYDKMTVESLAHDCFKRSGYAINKQDLISRIEFLCEQYHQSKVNNVVLDDVKVEFPIKKVEVNFDGDLLAEIEIKNNTLKVLRAVNGGGYKVNCEKVSITEK